MNVTFHRKEAGTYQILRGLIIVGYISRNTEMALPWRVTDHIEGMFVGSGRTLRQAKQFAEYYFDLRDFCQDGCGRLVKTSERSMCEACESWDWCVGACGNKVDTRERIACESCARNAGAHEYHIYVDGDWKARSFDPCAAASIAKAWDDASTKRVEVAHSWHDWDGDGLCSETLDVIGIIARASMGVSIKAVCDHGVLVGQCGFCAKVTPDQLPPVETEGHPNNPCTEHGDNVNYWGCATCRAYIERFWDSPVFCEVCGADPCHCGTLGPGPISFIHISGQPGIWSTDWEEVRTIVHDTLSTSVNVPHIVITTDGDRGVIWDSSQGYFSLPIVRPSGLLERVCKVENCGHNADGRDGYCHAHRALARI
jgi:hypothetical protein